MSITEKEKIGMKIAVSFLAISLGILFGIMVLFILDKAITVDSSPAHRPEEWRK